MNNSNSRVEQNSLQAYLRKRRIDPCVGDVPLFLDGSNVVQAYGGYIQLQLDF